MNRKLFSPSAERNCDFILDVLRRQVLPPSGTVLELASGSGQHAVHFAKALPQIQWQPSETDRDALSSIRGWRDEAALENLLEPVALDVTETPWPVAKAEVIVSINLVHISPLKVSEEIFKGAKALLPGHGLIYFYGPFIVEGIRTASTNLDFDAYLKGQNPEWGVRDLKTLVSQGEKHSFSLRQMIPMPGNNYSVIISKT